MISSRFRAFRSTFLFSLALLAASAGSAAAQQRTMVLPVDSLARVRVTQEADGRLLGTFVAADARTLVVQSGTARREVPLEEVRRLEVSRGERSVESGAWRGAKRGFLGGLIVGALLGVAAMSTVEGDDYVGEEVALIGFTILGTGVGTVAGTVLGAASPGERWERVPLPR